MEILTVILLLLLGIVLVVVEFMLIPGLSIAGIGALLTFGASVYLSFKYWGNFAGFVALAVILIFVPILLYLLFKGRAVKPMMLESEISGKVETVDTDKIHVGDIGITIGRLAPIGNVKINGSTAEARSKGIYIDQKTKIKVIKIEGNTVIVEPIND
ncbi:MAG TPA: NfeD family protein [Prolixibacteraceae bacterium]|nr:NfeD family protein [Prolixibacteraceae bacterium]